ncbi:general transcription factor 3C polypeptide 3 [Anthonomus grandis grandis]|uniref:general transcription factor 3C polypeptide 3 n=1 Tax=Anthonomus grandis grandis TaxID=2921223 RepID=UPI00216641F4|nr:general transcription factor 3C polypeptide 3 [Anthonomus grandis grandis]
MNATIANILESVELALSNLDGESETDEDNTGSGDVEASYVSKLSVPLRGLMGEANLRFARGEVELSKKMCFEIIRQCPDAYEPYLTLAQMYENSNTKKYKGFLMLASYLQPSNYDIWCRLAECEIQENQIEEALSCYSRAIQHKPSYIPLHLKRLKLVKEKCEKRIYKIPQHLMQLARHLSKRRYELILKICTQVANHFYKEKNYIRAIEALKICITKIPDKTNQDVLNMMLELLLFNERYSECLDIFTQFCGFQFDVTVGEDMSININSFSLPDNLHMDLKAKFIVCMIGLQSYHLIDRILKDLIESLDVETFGTLFLDITEALITSHYYKEALDVIIPLVKSKNFSLAGIWLKYAECLVKLNLNEQAVDAYRTVINMAPNHIDVLYPLAMLLLKLERKQDALDVLSQDLSSGKLHVAVLMEQMKLLKQIGDLDNYWKCCELLLSRHCMQIKNYSEMRVAMSHQSVGEKRHRIMKLRTIIGDTEDVFLDIDCIFEPSVEDEYKLYREILEFAIQKRAYHQFQKLSFMGLLSKRFKDHFNEILLCACYSCVFSGDYHHGYQIAKDICIRYRNNNNAINLISLLSSRLAEAPKLNRFLDSFTLKNKIPLEKKDLLKANSLCTFSNLQQCLNYFLKEYRLKPEPYYAFLIALIMLQQYCKKKKPELKNKVTLEVITYLFYNYGKLRTKSAQQEIFYNLGRMYHQIGMLYLAEHYYKLVLKDDNELAEHSECFSLKREAAFNLHLIYKASGNLIAARKILYEHIVID